MEGTDEDVLERMAEQKDSFAVQSAASISADRINDGNNYKGLLTADAYKKRKVEVMEDPEQKARETLQTALQKDNAARDKDEQERAEREQARKEKLQRQLQASSSSAAGDAADDDGAPAQKKKKKKKLKGEATGLSFDAEEEDG